MKKDKVTESIFSSADSNDGSLQIGIQKMSDMTEIATMKPSQSSQNVGAVDELQKQMDNPGQVNTR